MAIAQSNFRDGLAIMKNDAIPDVVEYNILGACVRMYVYALGTGADYIAVNYLKPLEASSVLGDLGSASQTMVCCTLVQGNVLPQPEANDIHVVSVGNSDAYNEALKACCGARDCGGNHGSAGRLQPGSWAISGAGAARSCRPITMTRRISWPKRNR